MRTVDKYGEQGTLSVVASRQGPVFTLRATNLNTQKIYVLPTQCICVFCVDLRTNSDYFPIQH